jgi:hypothetical protein
MSAFPFQNSHVSSLLFRDTSSPFLLPAHVASVVDTDTLIRGATDGLFAICVANTVLRLWLYTVLVK